MKRIILLLFFTSLFACQNKSSPEMQTNQKFPNIIYIFTDDLGYGNIDCLGATDIKTPQIDRMACIVYMRGNEVVDYHFNQKYITKTYTKEALIFIEKNMNNPFYLYLTYNIPHTPIYASEDFLGTSERGLYKDVIQEIQKEYLQMGKLPESLDVRTFADESHL